MIKFRESANFNYIDFKVKDMKEVLKDLLDNEVFSITLTKPIMSKEMALDLVKGTYPNYSLFKDFEPLLGTYSDQYGRWSWNLPHLTTLDANALMSIYKRCKDSWKKEKGAY